MVSLVLIFSNSKIVLVVNNLMFKSVSIIFSKSWKVVGLVTTMFSFLQDVANSSEHNNTRESVFFR